MTTAAATATPMTAPISTRAKFVLVNKDLSPGWLLMYVNGEGLARVIAQNAADDLTGADLEWLGQCAAELHHVRCERVHL